MARRIAGDYPPRSLAIWQLSGIPFSLLEGVEDAVIGLPDTLSKVFFDALLLNHDMRALYVRVNERGMVEFDLLLKRDEIVHMLDAENLGQERCPEDLAIAFLVALSRPSFYELFGGFLLLDSIHGL